MSFARSVSNRKELVDLGIFVTLLELIDHLCSLPNPVRRENGPPMKENNPIFQNESRICLLNNSRLEVPN